MNTRPNIQLLLIDPQNDFCDIPGAALPVVGANEDMNRLAAFIDRVGSSLSAIHVTLDAHHPVDIAHPSWWRDAAGEAPAPFTLISAADLATGSWRARDERLQQHSQRYVETLEQSGRYLLVIWPEHCLIGSWGGNIQLAVKTALDRWARASLQQVDFIQKGSNPGTEHYSAVQAEVPDAADPETLPNARLVASLATADRIIVAGEALSHCVANTVRDLAHQLGEERLGKLVLLTDCSSPVAGFENLGSDFVRELTARGMQTMLSTEFQP